MLLRLLLCALLIPLTASIATAEIYKTVDKNGNVVYTDTPSGDQPAEPVKLPPVNTLPAEGSGYTPPAPEIQQPSAERYQVQIVSPRDNVTIPPGQRDLGIVINLDHPLGPDNLLLYFMNGELLEETQNTSIFIPNIIRGSHILTVEVIDRQGNSLGKSAPITVNVIRPSILGPRAKPKPAP